MKIVIDTDRQTMSVDDETNSRSLSLYSDEAFGILSQQWLKVGWNQKYSYSFTWLGQPVIQLPEDLIRIQEAIYRIQPDVIIETGVAHGGSLIYYATLCHAIGRGHVFGIDIEIRPRNRAAIEQHPLASYITLIEGSSTATKTLAEVKAQLSATDKVLVILDSNHSYHHVLDELTLYGALVTPGSYLVATDGIMRDLHDVPKGTPGWKEDNPTRAAQDFAASHPEFVLQVPTRLFDESQTTYDISYWPGAWLKRV